MILFVAGSWVPTGEFDFRERFLASDGAPAVEGACDAALDGFSSLVSLATGDAGAPRRCIPASSRWDAREWFGW